jgi:hypothetical protein
MISPTVRQYAWRVRCYINGREYKVVGFPKLDKDLSYWFDAKPSTIEVELVEIPPESIAYTILNVQVSYDGGTTWLPYFYGYAMPKSISIVGFSRTVTGVDILYLLNKDASEEIAWSGTSYLDAIEDVLLDAGIPSSSINLPSSLGDLSERNSITYTVTTDDNLKDVMSELLKFGRYVVYVDASGSVRMRKYSTVPEASAAIKYSMDDKQADEYGIARASFGREVGTNDRIVRKVVVTGGDSQSEVEGSWETTSSKAADGVTMSDSNDFAVTSEQCVELATDWGQDECRNDYRTVFSAPIDPGLTPGMCIEIKAAANGFDNFTPARVIKVSYQKSMMVVTISTNPRAIGSGDDGGEGLTEDGYDDVAGPLADFSYTIEREGDLYGIILEDTSTSDSSSISSRTWSVSGAGAGYPTPALGTSSNEMTVVDTLTGVSITLEATDANSATDSVTKSISETEIDLYTRQLQTVVDGAWKVLLDYDSGWFNVTPAGKTAAVVPRASDTQYLFAAMSDGTIWRYDVENSSVDAVQVGGLSGTPADIAQGEAFVSEESANVLIVAHGTAVSVTYNALNASPTWTTITFAVPPTAVGVNPYNTDILFACAGNIFFISYDRGGDWQTEVTGEIGSTAVDFCTFPWSPGTAVLFSGYSDIANAILPSQADWGAISPDGDMQSITPGLEDEVLRVSSSAGEIFLVAADGTVSETQDGTDTSDIDRIVRDGFYNQITWLADNSTFGVGKQVADADVFSILSATTGATSVGYGRIISVKETPVKPVRAAVIWAEELNDVWIYRDGSWTQKTNVVPSAITYSMTWQTISVDNADPQKIMAFGISTYASGQYIHTDDGDYIRAVPGETGSPFRYSDDGGDTWYDLRVNLPGGWSLTGLRVGPWYSGAFLLDGKLYTLFSSNTNDAIQYVVYGGEPVWNASGYYEIDSSELRGPFNPGFGVSRPAGFRYHKKDANGYPLIPWISTSGEFGWLSYDSGTDTVSFNLRSISNDENANLKWMTCIIGSDELVYSTTNRQSRYFADYTSGNPTTVDIAIVSSFNYLSKHASDKNDVLYSVEDRLTKPNRLVSPYDTRTSVSILENEEDWITVARNEQDSGRGRFVAIGNDNDTLALYDADKDTWQVIDLDVSMTSMSSIAFAVFAE